ncbi:MAG: hypothetical protein OEZ47_05095 [Gammaproteobacteria bacterium]|nr:hypothetical protein [Gammaproteobacteria bacterium]
MEALTEIKIIMTIALVFYATAIVLGKKHRKWGVPRWCHISAGVTGFVLDMWATWMMEQLRDHSTSNFFDNWFLVGHTVVSTLAIVLFLGMITLGLTRKINIHRFVAWYAFVPVWFLSYTSGIALVSMDSNEYLAATEQVPVVLKQGAPTQPSAIIPQGVIR